MGKRRSQGNRFYMKQNLQCELCSKSIKKDGMYNSKTKRMAHRKCVVKKLKDKEKNGELKQEE